MTAVNEIRTLEIVEADYIANDTGTGMILAMKAQFIDVPFNPYGPLIDINYNLENENEQAQEIGQRDFAALRRAIGVLGPQSTDELLFKPFRAVVTHAGKRLAIRQYLFDTDLGPVRDERGRYRKAA